MSTVERIAATAAIVYSVSIANHIACVKEPTCLVPDGLVEKDERRKDIADGVGADRPRTVDLAKPLAKPESWLPPPSRRDK